MAKIKLNCRQCGKKFKVFLYRESKAKFCSYECYWLNKKGNNLTSKHKKKIAKSLMGRKAWNKNRQMRNFLKEKFFICSDCGKETKRIGTNQIRCKECVPIYKKNLLKEWRKNNLKTPPKNPVICKKCNKKFKVYDYRIKNGEAKFCSRKCAMQANIKPSLLEKKIIKVIENYNLPYKYVGDGKFFIERLNPDFINTNGKKIAIEAFYERHKEYYVGFEKWKKHRLEVFSKYGWEIIFLEGKGLTNHKILNSLEGGH